MLVILTLGSLLNYSIYYIIINVHMKIHSVLIWYVRNVSSLFFNTRISFSIYCYYEFIFLYSRTYEEEKTVYDVSYG